MLDSKLKEMLIRMATAGGVSDIHIVDGYLYTTRYKTIVPVKGSNGAVLRVNPEAIESLVKDIAKVKETDHLVYDEIKDLDTAYSIPNGDKFIRLRANVAGIFSLEHPFAVSVTLRVIRDDIQELHELGLPENKIKNLLKNPKGIILVTGPTGSGKSTTLASMIEHVNVTENKKIITLEDPIECIFTSKKSLVIQREVGVHTEYKAGLHKALRQAPNIILIGEMRDRETAEVALTAAETGHLVLSTLHTRSSIETISRIVDLYPPERANVISSMLSQSLLGIISQDLIRTNDNNVRLAYEYFSPNVAQRNLIRGNKDKPLDIASLKQSFDENRDNESMFKSLDRMVKEGLISKEKAEEHRTDKD